MNAHQKEALIHALAAAIDRDAPPAGVVAKDLARAVVTLVQDRTPAEAQNISMEINALALGRFKR